MNKKVVWQFILIAAKAIVEVITSISNYYNSNDKNSNKGGD